MPAGSGDADYPEFFRRLLRELYYDGNLVAWRGYCDPDDLPDSPAGYGLLGRVDYKSDDCKPGTGIL